MSPIKPKILAAIALVLGLAAAGVVSPASQAPGGKNAGASTPLPAPPTAESTPSASVFTEEAMRRALSAAGRIEDPSERAEALLDVGRAQARQGMQEAARETLRQALRTAATIPPNARYTIPHPVIRVAQAMAETGDREAAHQGFQEALRVIRSEDEHHQGDNWLNLLPIQLAAEGRDACRETIAGYRQFRESDARRDPRSLPASLVGFQAMSGDFEGALRAVHQSEEFRGPGRADLRRQALLAIVAALRDGDQEVARPILAEAQRAVDDNQEKPWFNAQDLATIAKAQVRLRMFPEAIATTEAIITGGLPGPLDDSARFNKAGTFLDIAEAQCKARDEVGARRSTRRAVEVVGTIGGEDYKTHPLGRAVTVLVRVGDLEGALSVANSIRADSRPPSLVEIASARERSGDQAGARVNYRQALQLARDRLRELTLHPLAKPKLLPEITRATEAVARIEAQMGDMNAALQTIDSLEDEARQDALQVLASTRARVGDARSVVSLIDRISSPRMKDRAWIGVACSLPARHAPEIRP